MYPQQQEKQTIPQRTQQPITQLRPPLNNPQPIPTNNVYLPSNLTVGAKEYIEECFGFPRFYLWNETLDLNKLPPYSQILVPIERLKINPKAQRDAITKAKLELMNQGGHKQNHCIHGFSADLYDPIRVCFYNKTWYVTDGQQRTDLVRGIKTFPKLKIISNDGITEKIYMLCKFEGILNTKEQAKRFIDLNVYRNNVSKKYVRKVSMAIDANASQAIIDEIAPQYNLGDMKKIIEGKGMNDVVANMQKLYSNPQDVKKMLGQLLSNLKVLYSQTTPDTKWNANIVIGLGNFMVDAVQDRILKGNSYSELTLKTCIRDRIASRFDEFLQASKEISAVNFYLGVRKYIEQNYNSYIDDPDFELKLYTDTGTVIYS